MPSMINSRASSVVIAQALYTLLPANLQSRRNDAPRRSRIQTDKAPGNSLVSTAQPDKKKACAEKTSNSWTSFPRMPSSYQVVLWKQESFLEPCRFVCDSCGEHHSFDFAGSLGVRCRVLG